MPSRNTRRVDLPEAYYHVYARGINKADIFVDDEDKSYFLYLISRHLSKKPTRNNSGYAYPHFRNLVELLCYCVMNNHFHFLLYQQEKATVQKLLQSILSSYTLYYNRKFNRSGPLFESRYKSSHIADDSYLMHVSRYIHLNPRRWKQYKYSSMHAITTSSEPEWLQTKRLLSLHKSRKSYQKFVAEYENTSLELKELKRQLKSELEA